jgi:hypothetical protein
MPQDAAAIARWSRRGAEREVSRGQGIGFHAHRRERDRWLTVSFHQAERRAAQSVFRERSATSGGFGEAAGERPYWLTASQWLSRWPRRATPTCHDSRPSIERVTKHHKGPRGWRDDLVTGSGRGWREPLESSASGNGDGGRSVWRGGAGKDAANDRWRGHRAGSPGDSAGNATRQGATGAGHRRSESGGHRWQGRRGRASRYDL